MKVGLETIMPRNPKVGSVCHADSKSASHIHSQRAKVLALAYINISFRHFNLYDDDVINYCPLGAYDLADISRASWGWQNQGVFLTFIMSSVELCRHAMCSAREERLMTEWQNFHVGEMLQ